MKDLRLITIDRDGRPTGFGGVGSAVMAKVTVIKPKPGMRPKETGNGVDRYLAALPDDQRRALERLRRTIRAAAPRAEECISYRLPTFRLDGKTLVAFGATARERGTRRG